MSGIHLSVASFKAAAGGGGGGYTQNFNALTTGLLHGQDSWAEWGGGSQVNVQTGVVYEGAKAISLPQNAFDSEVYRTFTPLGVWSVYVAVRKTSTTDGNFFIKLQKAAFSDVAIVRFSNAGVVAAYDGSSGYVSIGSYPANTWCVVNIEIDAVGQPNKFRARVHDGSSWGAFSAWRDVNGTFTTIDRISFSSTSGSAATAYFDLITDTDPT